MGQKKTGIKRRDIELMAPAGDFESLTAAIQGGADSVYFGVGKLNMRSGSAKNFTAEDLPEISERCLKHGVQSYLTLNVVLYDQEVGEMRQLLDRAKNAGISAIIASDQAVIAYARSIDLPIHISTQANISNLDAVKFYAAFAEVMVLARELTLDQMAVICKGVEADNVTGPNGNRVRIEVFIHGALCMAISGKCYLSLHQSNKSANRGQCRQECRKAYEVTEKETGQQLLIENEYMMSPKDLATIGFLDKIVETGVRVLKIEGRGRSPEYVKTVTECYHEALQAIDDGTYGKEKIEKWESRLQGVFNRGFWDGYYLGRKLGEWSERYGSHATRKKVYIGKGTNYFPKIGIGEFLVETKSLAIGDEILITGPTTGVIETTVQEIRIDDKPVKEAVKGVYCSMPVPIKIRRSDKLFKVVDASKAITQ